MDEKMNEKDFANIVWNYFSIHASQRMQILNFYIVLETFFVTALLTTFQLENKLKFVQLIICIAIIFFSIIFFALDTRTKHMIKFSEESLIEIEKKYVNTYGKEIMIFSIEKKKTEEKRKNNRISKYILSYSKLLHLIFAFFSLIGMIGAIWIFVK